MRLSFGVKDINAGQADQQEQDSDADPNHKMEVGPSPDRSAFLGVMTEEILKLGLYNRQIVSVFDGLQSFNGIPQHLILFQVALKSKPLLIRQAMMDIVQQEIVVPVFVYGMIIFQVAVLQV